MLCRVHSNKISVVVSAFIVFVLGIHCVGEARAQVSGATLSGSVTDASGAVIPGVTVSIKNKATGVVRSVVSDEAGFYSAPNLQAGTYEVTASQPGFSTVVQSNIPLAVGAQQQLNISMKVGESAQTVEVTEAAPMVQVTSSVISAEVESTTVRELPLNGRDWASLATLSPGVNAIETQMPFENGATRGNRGFGAQLTIAGGRPTQNNYRLDGLSINDYGNGGPGSVIGVSLGVDAIQEFSVLTGNYSAEYGRTSGGVVNAISKSGTNAFHGDVYEFLRNDALDANDFFSNASGLPKPAYRRNQFGAAAGGPIRKDRTFIFGDYEGIRQSQGIPTSNTIVLSDAARAGNLEAGHVDVDPLVQKYLALIPRANGPVAGDKGVFTFAGVRVVKENFFTSRVDHKISDKNSVFGTYMYDNAPFNQPDGFNNVNILSQTTRNVVALENNYIISPGLVNSARLGFNRNAVINYQGVSAINPAAGDPALGMMPGVASPDIRISGGFARVPPGMPGGASFHYWNSYQFYDDAFLTHGTHSLKFGFAGENMRYNPLQFYQRNGLVRFTSLANFLTNRPNSLEGGLPDRVNPRAMRQTLLGGYIQDDWHIRHNVTLNLGLRYEMATVLSEAQGKLTNIRTMADSVPYCGTSNPDLTLVFGKPGCTGTAPYYSNPTLHNFEPRVGFAWDPRGDGKMAIRGGFAIFDILPLPGYYYTQQGIETPFTLTGNVQTAVTPLVGTLGIPPSDPRSAFARMGPAQTPGCNSPLGTCSLTAGYMEPNPKRNYVEQWNINVQREIAPNLTATLGYIGSHGVHMLIRGDDGDMVIPTKTSAGYLWPYNPTGKDLRINPNFGGIRFMSFGASSSYEGLQASVQKRMSRGLQFGGSYTYSKAMDDSSATIAGDAFSNSVTSWFWFAPSISRAPSDFDVRQSAAINGIWQLPVSQSLHGPAATALRGWEIGGILKMNSGIPTTPLIGGDPLGVQNSGSDAFSIPDRVPGCDPVNHNFKTNPGGVFLGYMNPNCFSLPKATPEIASLCVPFVGKGTLASPQFPGTCSNLLGNAGRNSIYGPGLFNVDFSLYKNFAVREKASVQFRAEFFNVLNHTNFGPPLPFFGSSTAQLFNQNGTASGGGGLQAPLATQPRDIQFALKVIW